MKKKLVEIIAILILVVLISFIAYSNYIKEKRDALTGETVTGEATNSNFAVSVSVLVSVPSLTIISPENKTYVTNKNLLLNFTSSGTNTIWYNLDQISNKTITSSTYFNTTQGTHTLYLYANNTDGNLTLENITFTVNINKFKILYNTYSGSKKGESNNFNKSSYEDLQNLSDIILEQTNWGKIEFSEAINVTEDLNFSDNEVDLDSNINISENRIEINSTALPNFNKSAILYLYNLTFTDPRILKDGAVCPTTTCTEIDYSGGTLIFSAPSFTVYSAEETPGSYSPPSGGGSRSSSKEKSFDIDLEEITVQIKQGETMEKEIILINNGDEKLSFSLEETPSITQFIKIDEKEFELNPGEVKMIIIDFLVKEETIPNLYLGRIFLKAGGIEKDILIGIEVVTKNPLFDLEIDLPERFLHIKPGEEIYYQVKIFNVGDKKNQIDVFAEHKILDANANEISSESQFLAVITRTEYIKEVKIPENLAAGKYVIYVKTTYNGEVASASVWFEVKGKSFFTLKNIGIIGIILIILLTIILYKYKKKKIIFGIRRKKEKQKKGSFDDYKKRLKKGIEKHKK